MRQSYIELFKNTAGVMSILVVQLLSFVLRRPNVPIHFAELAGWSEPYP